MDDLKTYQQNRQKLKTANEIVVQAKVVTRAIYSVKKCAKTVFKKGRIIKGEELQMLQERMKTLDPKENETYKFLGYEQAERIDAKKVIERIQIQMEQRTRKRVEGGLYNKNSGKSDELQSDPSCSLHDERM